MKQCPTASQHCWIDWNSAALCLKQLFHIGVWPFPRFERPLLATILCVWEIWSGSNNCVYMYHVFHSFAQQQKNNNNNKTKKKRITTPILKPAYEEWMHVQIFYQKCMLAFITSVHQIIMIIIHVHRTLTFIYWWNSSMRILNNWFDICPAPIYVWSTLCSECLRGIKNGFHCSVCCCWF